MGSQTSKPQHFISVIFLIGPVPANVIISHVRVIAGDGMQRPEDEAATPDCVRMVWFGCKTSRGQEGFSRDCLVNALGCPFVRSGETWEDPCCHPSVTWGGASNVKAFPPMCSGGCALVTRYQQKRPTTASPLSITPCHPPPRSP